MVEGSALISRVRIENYKSIAACDVRLGPLAILVGRNGSGKSNFLDALRFVADALRGGLDQAVRVRGSVDDLRYRDAPPDVPIGLQFDLSLPSGMIGHYMLRLAQGQRGGYAVVEERCTVERAATGQPRSGFHVRDGQVLQALHAAVQEVPTDRLYLPVSNSKIDRLVYDVLANMAFYHLIPARMRSPQPHEAGDLLLPDGSNVASVLLRLTQRQPEIRQEITEYLHAVLPTLQAIEAVSIGGYDALQFYQQSGDDDPMQFYQGNGPVLEARRFPGASMSDGTLHALGVLVALFQDGVSRRLQPRAIGIEEPEAALHPAATAVLRDALLHASESMQVIVTTQSPDLLDSEEIVAEALLAVTYQDGASQIGPLGEGQRSIIRDRLATAGELLRTSTLRPGV